MQELKITQEMDGYDDELSISDKECCTDQLFLKVSDDKNYTSIVLEKYHAKQIISFLQNYFNL
jgi:hypothetical protein